MGKKLTIVMFCVNIIGFTSTSPLSSELHRGTRGIYGFYGDKRLTKT